MTTSLIKKLSMEARIVTLARTLPGEGTIPADQIEEVRALYQQHTFAYNITDGDAARQIGVANSTLSQWRSGTYAADASAVTRKVNAWLESDSRRRSVTVDVPYVKTVLAEQMRAMAMSCHRMGKNAAVVAPAGSGKTMLIEILADDLRGWKLYCDETMTRTVFLERLAETVGAKARRTTPGRVVAAIVEKIKGSRRPIFLDEAHLLPKGVFPLIRSIYDQSGCVFLMFGTAEILDQINDRSGGRGQMSSRCWTYNFADQSAEDPADGGPRGSGLPGAAGAAGGRPLFTKTEIRQFLNHLNVRLGDGAFEMFWGLACLPDHGCLRLVRSIVDFVRPTLEADEAISRQIILEALRMQQGSLGVSVYHMAKARAQSLMRATGVA